MNVILCGYKSCGKSTIAKAYAQSFSCEFMDTDSLIIATFQSSRGKQCAISEIHREMGELAFRQLEMDVIKNIGEINNAIIATGGGAVAEPSNVEHLKSLGKIIYLKVEHHKLYERLSTADTLPSFIRKNKEEVDLKKYVLSRDDLYNRVSDYILDISDKKIEEIMSIIHQYRCHHGE